MPHWMMQYKESVLVYTPDDLIKMAPLIQKARELWKKYYQDLGPVYIGGGIAINLLRPRWRYYRSHIIIEQPGQGSGSESVYAPLNFLAHCGIAAYHEYGRAD
jgi:hypothetical protein